MRLHRSPREQSIVARRLRLWRRFHSRFGLDDQGQISGGRFRKRHPFDCGVSRCYLCHGEKLRSVPSHRRRIADLSAAEQIFEL